MQRAALSCVLQSFQQNSFILSSTKRCLSKVYEVRRYDIIVHQYANFRQLTLDHLHLRLQQSRVLGYWQLEMGALNSVFHIWEYDSLEHRAEVRQKLAVNEEWMGQYFGPVAPMIDKQDNCLTSLFLGDASKAWPANGQYNCVEVQLNAQVDRKAADEQLKDLVLKISTHQNVEHLATFRPILGDLRKYWIIVRSGSFRDLVQLNASMSLPHHGQVISRLMLPYAWDQWLAKLT